MKTEKETVTVNQNGRKLCFFISERDGITIERYLTHDVGTTLIFYRQGFLFLARKGAAPASMPDYYCRLQKAKGVGGCRTVVF